MKHSILATGLLTLSLAACSSGRTSNKVPGDGDEANAPQARSEPEAAPDSTKADENEAAHHVVFADRTSYAYLLLVDESKAEPPTRDQLEELVRTKLEDHQSEREVELLLKLVDTEPPKGDIPGLGQKHQSIGQTNAELVERDPESDLLGLHIGVLEVEGDPERPLVSKQVLSNPILTRELDAEQKASLPSRSHALLLRVAYRNQHGVRGLRMLQTLVRLVAQQRGALIHDWDTGETMDVEAFTRRRLQASLGNVADQIAVVPFADPRHGKRHVRLATRGMRRFGSPELELDGLPKDPALLQKATHLLYGLAFQVTRHSEVHRSGLAVEADDVLTVHFRDIEQAYSSREAELPRCADCEEEVLVHLVQREAEPQDPRGHPVARVVAPRSTSDRSGYDHPQWAKQAVLRVLGR